ncbi:hypothetical protein BCR32DRAFT_324579 [Anaeromyces robustus]|uniref:Uncharacterized protein n=1 Tax=Anaeromyces robustus TaxID=1754192 RepID=A0A1Y1XNA6_9FUNG|nr:hypothetical protein BCR32DRAFT_324579 [Anaeromyces robustus]|eukprot:ORX87240.1 hypothetical protein BCR32DRAFT_324579 [Anaeromyces robustus]
MVIIDYFIVLLILYVVVDYFCIKTTLDEDEENSNGRNLTTVVVIPTRIDEDKPEDDLPPYTPPSPKTQAVITDLPPSYDETFDITEVNSNRFSNINMTNNNNNNNNNNINNNVNLPASYNVNSNYIPQIVITPVTSNTQTPSTIC